MLAIKQTLYRTGGDPRIVGALMNAVKNGKQVTAVTELKARFDEANNILWARRLEEAGVHVVYGIVNHKVHCKVALVVRRDDDGLRRYVHLGTGNYNPSTARLYTDLSLFTAQPDFGEDATNFFNLLTGICQFQGAQKLLIAPFTMHDDDDGADQAARPTTRSAGKPARIIAKMNALVDREIIEALYRASQAGREDRPDHPRHLLPAPGRARASAKTSRVRSIVGRFLEHSAHLLFRKRRRSRKSSSAAPTGCRAISSAASKWSSRSKIPPCGSESCDRFWRRSWRIRRKPRCSMPMAFTRGQLWQKPPNSGLPRTNSWPSPSEPRERARRGRSERSKASICKSPQLRSEGAAARRG